VNLWKKHLGRVPESLWEHLEMETLVLVDNDLTEIPARIEDLSRLQMLDLGHNALTVIPSELGNLENLHDFLYLHDNLLSELPSSLGKLKRLRYLNRSENKFAEFPRAACGMTGLIELRITDNQLTSLPKGEGERCPTHAKGQALTERIYQELCLSHGRGYH
jgi:Leucine-rich repeat (LRR) protein